MRDTITRTIVETTYNVVKARFDGNGFVLDPCDPIKVYGEGNDKQVGKQARKLHGESAVIAGKVKTLVKYEISVEDFVKAATAVDVTPYTPDSDTADGEEDSDE